MRFSNFSFAFTMIKAQCPDQRLNAQCESVCIENFSICMETCEDSRLALISLNDKEPKTYLRSCQSQCNREYVSCFEYCPCNEQCPAGCIDCENSICKGILVLNTFRFKLIHFKLHLKPRIARLKKHFSNFQRSSRFPWNNFWRETNIPLLLDFAGDVEVINFTFGENTEVEASCSTVYRGEQLIIGGWNERNQVFSIFIIFNEWRDNTWLVQISAVSGCGLQRKGDLGFSFRYGTCSTFNAPNQDENVLLCFDMDNQSSCRHFNGDFGSDRIEFHKIYNSKWVSSILLENL